MKLKTHRITKTEVESSLICSDRLKRLTSHYLGFEAYKRFTEKLNKKHFRVKDIADNISYRVINHWTEKGLIDNTNDGQWKEFSLIDILWLRIIIELREFGFSLEKIKNVKFDLFDYPFYAPNQMLMLNLCIMEVFRGNPAYLLISQSGFCYPVLEPEYRNTICELGLPHHVLINLGQLLRKRYSNKNFSPENDTNIALSIEEMQIILLLREKQYKEIKIRFKDGKIDLFEGTEILSNQKRIIEIIKEHDFQEVHLTQLNGKIVLLERTVKKKI